MSVNKVIVLFCNKTTILMKFGKNLGMRCICMMKLHDYAKEGFCTTNVQIYRRNVGDGNSQLIDQLIDSDGVKALMNVRKGHTCIISLVRLKKIII